MLDKAAEIIGKSKPVPSWVPEYWSNHRDRIAGDLSIVKKHPGQILDVGAAPYFGTLALHLLGRDVTGVDIDPSRLPVDDLKVVACNIETEPLPFPPASFDVVVFSEVFEHLRIDPLRTLSEIGRVLTPTGVLLLTTPNLWSVRGILRFLVRRQAWTINADPGSEYAKLHTIGHMGHVREYTVREISSAIVACGLEVEKVVWRAKTGPPWVTWLEWMIPPMRPYMTLLIRKGPHAPSESDLSLEDGF